MPTRNGVEQPHLPGFGKFDPEFRGPTAYKSQKKRVIPNKRHWYRGWWYNYNPNNVPIVTVSDDLRNKASQQVLADHMRTMLAAGL